MVHLYTSIVEPYVCMDSLCLQKYSKYCCTLKYKKRSTVVALLLSTAMMRNRTYTRASQCTAMIHHPAIRPRCQYWLVTVCCHRTNCCTSCSCCYGRMVWYLPPLTSTIHECPTRYNKHRAPISSAAYLSRPRSTPTWIPHLQQQQHPSCQCCPRPAA